MKKLLVLSIVSIASSTAFAQTKGGVKGFPKAEGNNVQKVIKLTPLKDEDNHYVEILVGKKTMTDGCNSYYIDGGLEIDYVQNTGKHYYKLVSNGDILSSLMACSDSKSVEKVVYIKSENAKYDSKNPIVVYVPKGYEVNYKIWSADSKLYKAK